MKLSENDKQILNYLQQDAKQTNKEIAQKLNLSTTAVFERVKKLELENVISKHVTLVNKASVNKNFVVLVHVKLIQHLKEFIIEFEKEIKDLEEVLECFHVSGDYDYILKVALKDMAEYRDFMVTKLTTIKHIGSTHSSFVIQEVKYSTAIKIE